MTVITTTLIRGKRVESYLKQHTRQYNVPQFLEVTKPLHVFKQVKSGVKRVNAIANLIIPVGAVIYYPYASLSHLSNQADRKMRASKAFVHSITTYSKRRKFGNGSVSVALEDCTSKKNAYSLYDRDFRYRVGRNVYPDRFSMYRDTCTNGIHFFLNLADALTYS